MDTMTTTDRDDAAETTAGIGHNSGAAPHLPMPAPVDLAQLLDPAVLRDQLGIDHSALISRRDELLAAAVRYHEKFPNGPSNDEESGKAGDFIVQIKKHAAAVEETRKKVKEPFLEAGRVIDAFLKHETSDKLADAAALINSKNTKYLIEKQNRERAEAQAAAARAAEEAQRLAEAAAAENNDQRAADIMDRAVEVAATADKAADRASGSAADLSRTRGAFGSVASLRDNWVYEVEDLMALVNAVAEGREPIHYLMVNDSVVAASVRAKNGVRKITGLKIENRQKSGVR